MFGKLASSLGITTGIKVDTILSSSTLQPGQTLSGVIHFNGGTSTKKINSLSLKLMTSAEVETNDTEYNVDVCLQQVQISGAFELPAHQQHQVPFSFQIPFETPITEVRCQRQNKTKVWVHTHLDVDWGFDAKDNDYLHILPTPIMQSFIQAMELCGFHLYTADVEKGRLRASNFASSVDCYQELEFKLSGFFNTINEVEVSFVATPNQTHIMLEVDKAFSFDKLMTLTLPNNYTDVQSIAMEIKRLLNIS